MHYCLHFYSSGKETGFFPEPHHGTSLLINVKLFSHINTKTTFLIAFYSACNFDTYSLFPGLLDIASGSWHSTFLFGYWKLAVIRPSVKSSPTTWLLSEIIDGALDERSAKYTLVWYFLHNSVFIKVFIFKQKLIKQTGVR